VPGTLHLPVPGVYHDTVTKSGSTSQVTQKYEVGATSNGATPVTVTLTLANGGQQITYDSWRADGIYLLQSTFVNNGQRTDCPFKQPVLQSPLPLRAGLKWTASGTCTTGAPSSANVSIKISAQVVGTAWQTIGGVRVATFQAHATVTSDISGTYVGQVGTAPQPYDIHSVTDTTDYFDPPAGLIVRDISNTTTTNNGATSTSSTDTLLTGLKPS